MKKAIKWVALAVVVLLLVAGLVVYMNLNSIVERTVETQATKQLNLKTELDGASVSLFGGSLELDDMTIASPPGFSAEHMFQLGEADVSVKLGELKKDPVHIQSVTLEKPRLVIERAAGGGGPLGMGEFNFKKAMEMMPQDASAPDPNAQPLKVIIDALTIQDAQVVIRPGIPGLAQEVTVPIPTFTMNNIGTGEGAQNGAALKDVAMQVITVLAGQAANSNAVPEQLRQLLNADLKQVLAGFAPQLQKQLQGALPGELGEALSGLLNDPNALLKDPGKVAGDALRQQGERIGGQLLDQALGDRASTTQSATRPADAVRGAIEKEATGALRGLLGGDKKDRDPPERK